MRGEGGKPDDNDSLGMGDAREIPDFRVREAHTFTSSTGNFDTTIFTSSTGKSKTLRFTSSAGNFDRAIVGDKWKVEVTSMGNVRGMPYAKENADVILDDSMAREDIIAMWDGRGMSDDRMGI